MKLQDTEIVLKKCLSENIDEICNLQESAFLHLENKDLLRRNSKEVLSCCLEDPHYTLGAFYNNTMIAFAILFEAGETEENIGWDIGLTAEELDKAINMKLIIVSPNYRGNGLQRKLMCCLEQIARERGKKMICGTVSPKNTYSCNNFIALGYKLKTTKTKYGGLERNIYVKYI